MQREAKAVERSKETEYPPSSLWVDPEGGGVENPEADRLSFEKSCREGLADKLAGLIAQQKPLVDKLRSMVRIGRVRVLDHAEGLVLHEREERLALLEPALLRNEALLKCCASWIGRGPRGLKARLRETEAALAHADGAVHEHAQARAAVLAAAPDAATKSAMEAAISPADRSLAARAGAARSANEAARAAVAENQAWIAAAEKRLASLRKKGSAAA